MSNEWSASSGNVAVGDRDGQPPVVEERWPSRPAFRGVLAGALAGGPEYFSLLRPWSELAIAERFAAPRAVPRHVPQLQPRLPHRPGAAPRPLVRALRQVLLHRPDPRPVPRRPPRCGAVFGGTEPLDQADLLPAFRTLLGFGDDVKPFECVGDVEECRTAAVLAGDRADRLGNAVLGALRDELGAGVVGRPPRRLRPRPADGHLLRPGPVCDRTSRGLTSAPGAVGVWGVGVEGRATLRRLAALGVEPAVGRRRRPPGRAGGGRRRPGADAGGAGGAGRLRLRGEEPGDQPSRRRRAARWPRGGALLVGGLGPLARGGRRRPGRLRHRHQGQEHHRVGGRRAGRGAGHRVPRRRQHRRCRRSTPTPRPTSTAGSSRRRASRPPTSAARRRWSW